MKVLENKKILFILPVIILLLIVFAISNSGAIYKQKLSTNANLNIENSEYTIVFNGNGNTSGTTASKTCEYTVNCQLTPNGFVKTGYHFDGWSTSVNGEKAYDDKASVLNLTLTGEYPLYARWALNELVFNNQTITKSYNTSTQTIEITEATNGTGEYSYTKTSEKNSSNIDTNYITLNGTTLTVGANTPIGTYTVVITVTDTNSGVTKSATYTITMEKSTPTVTLTEKTGMVYTGSEQVANQATVTPASDGTLTYTYYTDNACTVAYSGPICKRATSLHTATCNRTDSNGCRGNNKYANGATITYGNLETNGTLTPGDAFDCDVNKDGTYDAATERFYYVTSNGDNTVLIYYANISNDGTTITAPVQTSYAYYASANENWHGPVTAAAQLPGTAQWSNSQLIAPGTRQIRDEAGTTTTNNGSNAIESFTYTDKAARLLTYQEVQAACGSSITGKGTLDNCNYLMENVGQYETTSGTNGYWLESPRTSTSSQVWYVHGSNRYVSSSPAYDTMFYGVRPAITVLKSNIDTTTGNNNSIPKNAGSYYAKASVSETANYNSAESACVAHTIAKSNTTTILNAITNTYNGTSQPATGAISTLNSNNSAIENAKYTYTYYEGTSCDGIALASAPTNAGVYRVKATLTGTNNYNSSTSSCTVYTMNKKKPTITVTNSSVSLAYGGGNGTNPYTYDGDGVVSCTSSDTTKVTCNVNTSTNEITLTPVAIITSSVTITVSGAAGTNYSAANDVTFTVTVEKSTPTVTLTEKTGMVYTGEEQVANTATVTPETGGEVTYTYYTDNACTMPYDGPVCKRASELHKATCNYACQAHLPGGTLIEFGNLGFGESLMPGDAFDCDVNSDGIYDKDTERFYYVTSHGNEAVLLYYTNTLNGELADVSTTSVAYATQESATNLGYTCDYTSGCNYYGPLVAYTHLPSISQWSNTGLTMVSDESTRTRQITNENGTTITNSGNSTIESFTYTNKAARLLTLQELVDGCPGVSSNRTYTSGELNGCNYVLENTSYDISQGSILGFWLETPQSSNPTNAWVVYGIGARNVFSAGVNTPINYGVRPAITVSESNIDLSTETTNIPKNAGSYYSKATVSETTNYNSAESSCVAHTIVKSDTTTTLEAITNTYNGSAQPASGATSTLNSNNSTITNGEYTYTYYEGTSCDGIALANAPTNAGVYRVKATLTGTNNYNSSISSCTAYTMEPAKVVITINKGGVPWSNSGINVALYQNDTEVYGYSSSTVNGATVSFENIIDGSYDIYISQDENNLTTLIDSGFDVEVPTNTNQTINIYQITFDSYTGEFSNSNTTNSVVYYILNGLVTKYSHTENVDDTGLKTSNYGNSWTNSNIRGTDRTSSNSQAHVVTIPGASSITVELYYNGESTSYDWVSVWTGNYPSYTAASNYNSTGKVTTAMGGLSTNKYGGSQSGTYTVNGNSLTSMGHTTLTIPDDTVTFGFKSDGGGYGQGYGYYAIIKEGIRIKNISGIYEEPTKDGYVFNGWNTERDGSGMTYKDEASLANISTNLTLYAQYRLPTATFTTGQEFNQAIKRATGTTSATYSTSNSTITAFTKYSGTPTQEILNNATIVSSEASETNIYAWFDNGTIYWYTERDTIYFNADSSYMFYYLTGIDTIDLSEFDLSKVTSSSSMFSNTTNMTTLITPKVNASSSISLPKTMVKSDNTTYSSITSTMTQMTTLKVPYTITFDKNGGTNTSCTSLTKQIYPGNSLGTIPNPTFTIVGYTVDGYQTEANGGSAVTESTIPPSSITYYAKWIKNGVFAEDIKNNETYANANCESIQCMLEYFTQFREKRVDINGN